MIAHPKVVVVTGASGFIGRHLVAELIQRGYVVRVVIRQRGFRSQNNSGIETREVRDIVGAPWGELLAGAEAVVHLAAIAHRASPSSAQQARRVRAVNVEAVADLTRGAAAARVRRMVLLSSIGVLGATSGATAFDDASATAPHDFYSRTKLDAERAAADASAGSLLQLCVVRSPLVFGPVTPGNFGRLIAYIKRGVPLPLGAIDNRRSLISVWNLCDLLITCLTHPRAAERPILAADDEVVSTPDLVRMCAGFLGTRARLVPVPVALLRLACGVLGRQADFDRLCGSLTVDTRQLHERLGWIARLDLREGLRKAVASAGSAHES